MQHVQEKSGPKQSVSANGEGKMRGGHNQVQQEKDKLVQEKEEHDKKDDKQIQDFQQKSQVNQEEDTVSLQREIQQLQQLAREKDHVIEARERQLRELNQQLAASEQVTARLQQNLLQREKKIQKLQEENQHLQRELGKVLKRSSDTEKGKQTLSWKTCKAAPHQMSRGSATVCGNMAYFRPDDSRQVYSYNSEKEEWSTLPGCSTHNFTLTVVNGHVTAVGGRHNTLPYKLTNTLLSLVGEGGSKDWMEHFPRMPTKRELTAVVCSEKTVVVAGGKGEWRAKLTTVEVMDTDTLQWSTASRLPHSFYSASATICGDTAYLVGGLGYSTKSVFTYSLAENHPAWHTCTSTDLPVMDSTCVTLNGQLVAVGGRDSDGKFTNDVYSYNTETSSWKVISQMPTPRSWCLVAVLPGNKLMVVGGETYTGDTQEVHIASVQ